jgi:hypothetical protein
VTVGRRALDAALDEIADGGANCAVDLEQQRVGRRRILTGGRPAGQQQRDESKRDVPHDSGLVGDSGIQGTPDSLRWRGAQPKGTGSAA